MALGDSYITLPELKAYLGNVFVDTSQDASLTGALNSASREIERYTRRQFNNAGAATARLYRPTSPRRLIVDDFHTEVGFSLRVDSSDSGTFDTTWSGAEYQAEPLNGVRNGYAGWPYWRLSAVGWRTFPGGWRPSVEVTADWGWSSVPAPVKQACLILAAKNFQLKDSPLGVAGFGEFGVVRVQDDRTAMGKLSPFCRDRIQVA
ncbi:hypothetical protein ACMA1D_10700 [Streptomyces sp. 796.1]|uniref:hypothetical protein n=1 Tax=Streptomyces sp. 796.1 TaxID=3163029 RepID=UPI0039C98C8A